MKAKTRAPISYSSDKTPKFIEDHFVWDHRFYFKIQSGPTVYFVVDQKKNRCELVQISEKEDDVGETIRVESTRKITAYFSISELIIYPPISELHSDGMFSFRIKGTEIDGKVGPASIDEIAGELKSRALFFRANAAVDTITHVINVMKANKQYEVQTKPPYPGFFILNGKFTSTRKYTKPNKGQIREALEKFNELGDHYNEFNPKLGYIAHWMIMAPFSYVMKQKGISNLLSHLFLYGTTRTGKTTIATISCFLWNLDCNKQLTSGSHVHSPYQYGRRISQSTFPIIVDEGEAVFDNPDLRSMLKTSTHSTSARSRYNSFLQREEEIPALSLSIITSNYSKPNDGALGARLDVLKYTSTELRGEKERAMFDEKFQPKVQNGPLQVLRFIGEFVASRVIEDPGLLDGNWIETAKFLWQEMYELADLEMPDWMKKIALPERVEESFEDEKEFYISNIKSLILRKAEPTRIPLSEYVDKPVTQRDKAKDVVYNSREPWIYYHKPSTGTDARKEFVWIEKSIESDLQKEKHIQLSLDRIAELLGGKYVRKTSEGRKKFVAVFEYEAFLKLFELDIELESDIWG
ncbi:MAG: hypothetical protein ACC609_11210 [Methanobacterium formicicum]